MGLPNEADPPARPPAVPLLEGLRVVAKRPLDAEHRRPGRREVAHNLRGGVPLVAHFSTKHWLAGERVLVLSVPQVDVGGELERNIGPSARAHPASPQEPIMVLG